MQLIEFKSFLKKANMNKKEFAQMVNISYGTVNSWGVEGRAEVPEWVRLFLVNYMKAKQLDTIKSILDSE